MGNNDDIIIIAPTESCIHNCSGGLEGYEFEFESQLLPRLLVDRHSQLQCLRLKQQKQIYSPKSWPFDNKWGSVEVS